MRLLVLALCVTAVPALAQPLTWESLGGPYDGGVGDLHALPGGGVFARTGRSLYRSDDAGLTWARAEAPTPVHDLDAYGNDLVVAGPGGVYRSSDGGATWASLGFGEEGASRVAVGPNGLLLVLSGDEVYTSTDGGATWNPAEGEVASGYPRAVVITPGGVMLVARYYPSDPWFTIIYRSTNGGQTWAAASQGLFGSNFVLGAGEEVFAVGAEYVSFDFYIPPGLYRSTNGGASWMRIRQGSTTGGGRLADGRLWTGTDRGLLLSSNNGATWSAPVMEVAAPPSALLLPDGALLVGSGSYCHGSIDPPIACTRSGGLYRLGPGDETPRQVGLGLGEAPVLTWGPDGDLLAATSSNLLWWREEGEAWEPLRWLGGALEDVVVLGDDILVGSPDIYGIVRLGDGALLLETVGCYDSDCGVRALALDAEGRLFASAGSLLYGDAAGVFRSPDGGETWETSLPGINNVEVFAAGPDGVLYAGAAGEPFHSGQPGEGVYRTADGGETWEQLAAGLTGGVSALAVSLGGEVFAGSEGGGVFRLEGDAWEPFGLEDRTVSALVVTDRAQEVAGTDAGVFVFDGMNWVSGGLPYPTVALLLGPDGTGYAATDQGVFRSVGPLFVDAEGGAPVAPVPALSVYPNPSSGAATVTLATTEPGAVTVAVYDVLGRRVGVLHEGPLPAGTHRFTTEGAALPSGLYLIAAESERLRLVQRVAVVR